MPKLSEKSKKRLTVAGLSGACVVLVAVLAAFTLGGAGKNAPPVTDDGGGGSVAVSGITATPTPTPTAKPTSDVAVPEIKAETDHAGNSAVNTDQAPALDVEQPQHVETDLTNPPAKDTAPPADSPAPDDSTVPVTPSHEETVVTPEPAAPIPEGTEEKPGYVYVPGFGYIEDNGNVAEGHQIDGEGSLDEQVGYMGGE